jgi:pyruvate/2-oxoglutarate dehydrogenase complex dihydrolipoamide dehydrogenase (E3) component
VARYDNNLVVIGGGSAGLICAYIAATVRARVTLIERARMGGDCLNTGCVPSKTLIRCARAAQDMRRADRYGLRAVEPEVDFSAVMERVRDAVRTIEPKDSMARYRDLGVDCIAGDARLLGPHRVAVGDRVISTRSVVLATGASPWLPPLPGLAGADPLTSDNLWDLERLPGRLLVVGGGPIGCELAQAFARLGSRVTLIDLEARLLPREDPEVSAHLETVLRREGVDVRLSRRALRVVDGHVEVAVESGTGSAAGGGTELLAFDRILVAIGRRPDVTSLGLETACIELDADGRPRVDRFLRTTCPSVYACGDLVGPYQFTHMASHQAWFATVNALFGRFRRFPVDYRVVPWATFTDPEVARVGLSETEAREQGIDHEVTTYPLSDLDRAVTDGETAGWVKVITARGRDRVLGAAIVAPEAGETIGEFILAMRHGLGLKRLMSTIHVYPTRSEAVKLAAGAWRRAHAPERVLGWLGRLHRWLR